MKRTAIQHGEVILLPINKMPKGTTRKVTSEIVAHSETGHHHVVVGEAPFEVMGDASTPREFVEFVPQEVGSVGSAVHAQASAFGIPDEDYLLIKDRG